MKKLFFILAFLVIVSCMVAVESGPVVNGNPLDFWLRTWVDKSTSAADRQRAEEAIKQLGTNTIPYLITKLSALEELQKASAPSTEEIRQAVRCSGSAAGALGLLGQSVTSAIPQLTMLMNSENSDTVGSAAGVLAGLGPSGARAMLVGLKNSNPDAQAATAAALRGMGTNVFGEVSSLFSSVDLLDKGPAFDCCYAIIHSGVAVTNLVTEFTAQLQSTNSVTRYVSAMTLGEMGTNASLARSDLRRLSTDHLKDVRDAAEWALAHISKDRD